MFTNNTRKNMYSVMAHTGFGDIRMLLSNGLIVMIDVDGGHRKALKKDGLLKANIVNLLKDKSKLTLDVINRLAVTYGVYVTGLFNTGVAANNVSTLTIDNSDIYSSNKTKRKVA